MKLINPEDKFVRGNFGIYFKTPNKAKLVILNPITNKNVFGFITIQVNEENCKYVPFETRLLRQDNKNVTGNLKKTVINMALKTVLELLR